MKRNECVTCGGSGRVAVLGSIQGHEPRDGVCPDCDERIRSLTDEELLTLARGWQLPELSFGQQVRSMALELIGWRGQREADRERRSCEPGGYPTPPST